MQDSIFSGKSPDEVRAIYHRYRAGEKPSKLLDELGQPEMPGSRFYLVFDGVRVNNLSCAFCDSSPMLATAP